MNTNPQSTIQNLKSFLPELGLTPEQTPELRSNDRSRLLNFLLRWDYIADLQACLDQIIPRNRPLVSLLDLRVRALLAEEKPQEALVVMEERLNVRERTSLTAQSLLAQVYLALGKTAAAHQIAQQTTQTDPDSAMAWGLLGEVALADGDVEAAMAAYRHVGDRSPDSRVYLMGMMDVYRALQDWVTATAYAVRVLRTAEETETALSVPYFRRLQDYFRASGDATRAADVEEEIALLYADERRALQEALSRRPGVAPARLRPIAAPHVPAAAPSVQIAPAEFLATFDQIPVASDERAAVMDAAQRLFGFDRLLPGQVETVASVLRGEDVLTVLPTGGGKSLCYQLPALMADSGVTLVISPLIALMKDQVDSLPDHLRARATTINSSLEGDELDRRLAQVASGDYRLVYAAPERLRQPPFLHLLRRAEVNRLVIDEAHCVSVWGHDFRPDYLYIAAAREALGHPPLLALTATAPPRVRRDIIQRLGEMRIVAGDVTRPNLRLSVFYAANTDEKLQHLLAFCRAQEAGERHSGIIYAGTRKRCETLAALLQQQGFNATYYHAGIANRAQTQDDFMSGRVDIVVATVAFGMGIDKPDIRFIVHFVPPPSLESYYQEAGRAGRDGLPADCLLMYAPSDRGTLTRRVTRDALPVEFLREVYAAVKRRLNGRAAGPVAAADLERDLGSEDVRVRVALSLLEEVELLRRGPDVPRSALVMLNDGSAHAHPADFADFVRAAHLKPGQSLALNLLDVAAGMGLALDDLEPRLLAWADDGLLVYRPSGRDLSLTLLAPPRDASERVATLLERYATIQAQRVDEIAAYAQTARCRHGYLNAYLGGQTIERCTACDNCGITADVGEAALPDDREQMVTLLCALEDHGWGRQTLVRLLRGDNQAPASAQRHEAYGALAFRSLTALGNLVQQLEDGDFVQARTLSHGGTMIELTPAGHKAIQDPAMLDSLLPRPQKREQSMLLGEAAIPYEVDKVLLDLLKQWRLAKAKAQKVPAYVIFNNQTLEAIAQQRPTTLAALEKIKGLGPAKMEHYGQTVVELVTRYLKG